MHPVHVLHWESFLWYSHLFHLFAVPMSATGSAGTAAVARKNHQKIFHSSI